MTTTGERQYQNTTIRVPVRVYQRAKTMLGRSASGSFNEFVVQAIEEKMRRLTEAEIDAAFAGMADDAAYRREAETMSREFAASDWEALSPTEDALSRPNTKAVQRKDAPPHAGAAKTRSR